MNESDLEFIEKNEGYRSRVYKDHLGFDTIGIGFKVSELDLSKAECRSILKRKLSEIDLILYQKFKWWKTAHSNVRTVVLDMCYQMGVTGFSKFKKMIGHLENKNLEGASLELLDSKYAKEQTPNRANRNSKLLLGESE
tara:strand:+ start:2342 stop:2758 length:417 start_codon:yes stop_codon:yes gene_type:complete